MQTYGCDFQFFSCSGATAYQALVRGSLAFARWRASQETSCRVVKPFVQRHVPERVPLHVPPLASGPSSVEHEMIDDWYYVAAGTCWEWASGCSLVDAMQQHEPQAAARQLQQLGIRNWMNGKLVVLQ